MAKKPRFSIRTLTHGLCPKHLEISLMEIKAKMEQLRNTMGSFKVLIVEDSTLFRQLLKAMLQDRFSSIEIHEAMDGEEALQKTEVLRPVLIFMDIRLPGENGLELTRRIKARHPDIIVIILTAYDLPEYREVSQQYADYFFSKDSVTTENILKLVESVLSTKE